MAVSGMFIWEAIAQEILETEVPQWAQVPVGSGDEVPQKLKQLADIVYRF